MSNSPNILAVDDDPDVLYLLQTILTQSGYKNISVCLSANKALSMMQEHRVIYDCLIFDIQMPDMDGIELCRKVRALAKFKETPYKFTPIIMLTAMTRLSFMKRAFSAGATDYITKPFEINELVARVRTAVELGTSTDGVLASRRSASADVRTAAEVRATVALRSSQRSSTANQQSASG